MKIYDLHDAGGRVYAFEVSNLLLSRDGVVKVASSIPGAVVTRRRAGSWFTDKDEFCEFIVNGQPFVAWEPFGDNSRYWIGPTPPAWCEQVSVVREAFAKHKPFRLG